MFLLGIYSPRNSRPSQLLCDCIQASALCQPFLSSSISLCTKGTGSVNDGGGVSVV